MSVALKLVISATDVYQRLLLVDLDQVKASCVAHGYYEPNEIDAVAEEYRKYIALVVANNVGGLPISRKLDPFWHTHIIYTQNYMKMCMDVCGRYIHHRPKTLDDEKVLQQRFAGDTLGLYRTYFGEPESRFWDIVECACCDTCP